MMLADQYFAVRYGDIGVILYHEEMHGVRDLLFINSRREKTLKRFLEYCYMIDVKVAFSVEKGENPRGLKSAIKYVKDHEMAMTEEQLRAAFR